MALIFSPSLLYLRRPQSRAATNLLHLSLQEKIVQHIAGLSPTVCGLFLLISETRIRFRLMLLYTSNRLLYSRYIATVADFTVRQGHHHNGDQAARQPHKMCSICDADLRPLCLGYVGIGMSSFGSRPCNPISSPFQRSKRAEIDASDGYNIESAKVAHTSIRKS